MSEPDDKSYYGIGLPKDEAIEAARKEVKEWRNYPTTRISEPPCPIYPTPPL